MDTEEKHKVLKLIEKAIEAYADNEMLEAEGYLEDAIAIIEEA